MMFVYQQLYGLVITIYSILIYKNIVLAIFLINVFVFLILDLIRQYFVDYNDMIKEKTVKEKMNTTKIKKLIKILLISSTIAIILIFTNIVLFVLNNYTISKPYVAIRIISYIINIIGIIFGFVISNIQIVYDVVKYEKGEDFTIEEMFYDSEISVKIRASSLCLFNNSIYKY